MEQSSESEAGSGGAYPPHYGAAMGASTKASRSRRWSPHLPSRQGSLGKGHLAREASAHHLLAQDSM